MPLQEEKKRITLQTVSSMLVLWETRKILSENDLEIFAGETSLSFTCNSQNPAPQLCTASTASPWAGHSPQRSCPSGRQALGTPKQYFGLILQVFMHAQLAVGALPLEN